MTAKRNYIPAWIETRESINEFKSPYESLRKVFAPSGAEARAAFGIDGQQWGTSDGPYSHMYDYDKQGNMIRRFGWGGEVQGGSRNGGDTDKIYTYSTNKNQRDGFTYDAAGNLTIDNVAHYLYGYDATGQQTVAVNQISGSYMNQSYDGDGLRDKKIENETNVTYYVRSSVLGGAVVAELDGSGGFSRGYYYAGSQLVSLQQSNHMYWVHEDGVTKSKRTTDVYGNIVSTVELDPWGADTNRSSNSAFMPQSFTSYTRDLNGDQDAMARRYSPTGRFSQPDPYSGSYNLGDPQSLNRYAYVGNDPINRKDPLGLMCYNIIRTDIYADTHEVIGSWVVGQFCDFSGYIGDTEPRQKPKNNRTPLKPTPYQVQQQALNDCIDRAYREFRNALNANGLNLSGKLYSGFNAARPHLDDLIPLSLGALAGYFAKEAFGPITAGISSLYAPGKRLYNVTAEQLSKEREINDRFSTAVADCRAKNKT